METISLIDFCFFVKERVDISSLDKSNYISTDNMLQNKMGVVDASNLPSGKSTQAFKKGDVLVSNIRPYLKKIWLADRDGGCSNDVLVFRSYKNNSSLFLYYALSDDKFFEYATNTAKGTKMPRGDKDAIVKYQIPKFEVKDQLKIAQMLSDIDKKIFINRELCANLREQLDTIFTSWFIST